MTFLGLGLFFQNPPSASTPNAAPSIPAATLNFDFGATNNPPTGSNQALVFVVTSP